jgi:hypothetical protein
MSTLLIASGAGIMLWSLGYVAIEAFDDLGWFSEHNSDVSFVRSYAHLFRYNIIYTGAKYGLLIGAGILLVGFLMS